jgi:hypothetical protein
MTGNPKIKLMGKYDSAAFVYRAMFLVLLSL